MSDAQAQDSKSAERAAPKASALDYRSPSTRTAADSSGFFAIYKKGHGYWTRMGTAAGAAIVGLLSAQFFYQQVPVWLASRASASTAHNLAIGVAAGFFVVYGLLAWWLMNKPTNADFLIATDGEMKRVNWTSRKELIGSTKVVILFMFFIAAILFTIDIVFGYFFWFIQVLKIKPFI
jgi:preprotein translocase subunit SecE